MVNVMICTHRRMNVSVSESAPTHGLRYSDSVVRPFFNTGYAESEITTDIVNEKNICDEFVSMMNDIIPITSNGNDEYENTNIVLVDASGCNSDWMATLRTSDNCVIGKYYQRRFRGKVDDRVVVRWMRDNKFNIIVRKSDYSLTYAREHWIFYANVDGCIDFTKLCDITNPRHFF